MILSRTNTPLKGTIRVPGDKSISHRSIMFGSIAQGITEVSGFLDGADCRSTISCFRKLGIEITQEHDNVLIHGKGLRGLNAPAEILDCGNSGTTTRLISGILAAQPFSSTLTGDASIQKRPMKRIIDPLTTMGADITSISGNGCAPLQINGRPLTGTHYVSPVASAQVKSSVLLAGLYASGETSVTEPAVSRNHTELMLRGFGADISSNQTTATIVPPRQLYGQRIEVPGDISSAAYFIVAGLLVPASCIRLENVGINPTRDGILKVCEKMGAKIEYENRRESGGEPVCDLIIYPSELKGTVIEGDLIPTLIDEIPIIALLACFAKGTTVIKDAQELKVKESNRIDLMVNNLKKMGADIEAREDGMVINQNSPLPPALHGTKPGDPIETKLDHRIAMTFAIASLMAEGETELDDSHCVEISYPEFFNDLNKLNC